MLLTPPKTITFLVSAILAAATLLSAFASVNIPWVSANELLAMTIAWALLALAVLIRGL
ncbi:hypothetical protein H8M03_01715 [Sphingomonas sabuli]|uniref:Uncharacterized protein n=1 Tax=Sphingomonas sabuli TaxID=2764186 RepID=A0A7G9L3A6_9SPHN|nr:hypothetical protein [Sphingomonas sabuli]QNM83105.1 hypothetical protein H8M03_01715 [Sphingomonas sabuli]